MEIVHVELVTCMLISTDEKIHNEYYRYSANNWRVWMGERLEPFYDCEEIEKLYQQYIKGKK
jgi:hypothetical protein